MHSLTVFGPRHFHVEPQPLTVDRLGRMGNLGFVLPDLLLKILQLPVGGRPHLGFELHRLFCSLPPSEAATWLRT